MQEARVEGPRGCRKEELGELLVFLNNVFKPSLGENTNVGLEYSHVVVSAMNNSENMRIIKYNIEILPTTTARIKKVEDDNDLQVVADLHNKTNGGVEE